MQGLQLGHSCPKARQAARLGSARLDFLRRASRASGQPVQGGKFPEKWKKNWGVFQNVRVASRVLGRCGGFLFPAPFNSGPAAGDLLCRVPLQQRHATANPGHTAPRNVLVTDRRLAPDQEGEPRFPPTPHRPPAAGPRKIRVVVLHPADR